MNTPRRKILAGIAATLSGSAIQRDPSAMSSPISGSVQWSTEVPEFRSAGYSNEGISAGQSQDSIARATERIPQFRAPYREAVDRAFQEKLAESVSVLDFGADPTGRTDSTKAFQAAIDALTPVGGILRIPPGIYEIFRTLKWQNPSNEGSPGIWLVGYGIGATVIRSRVSDGPLILVRGIPQRGPISTTFFWGGGIDGVTFDGSRARSPNHNCLEITGWWYGEIRNCRIQSFSGNGISTVADLQINPNPDFSASIMFVRGVWIVRCGGWGFLDGGIQTSPGWSWDRVGFIFCGRGGALISSSSHSFTKCSFSACGWSHEKAPPADEGFGLLFTGAFTACSRHWVEGCEFDTSLTAHVAARFLSASSFMNNRFIFHDRYKAGHLTPRYGALLAMRSGSASVAAVTFSQTFFRFDQGGEATAFKWDMPERIQDISILNSVFTDHSGGTLNLVKYSGHDIDGAHLKRNFIIHDSDPLNGCRLIGSPLPFLLAKLQSGIQLSAQFTSLLPLSQVPDHFDQFGLRFLDPLTGGIVIPASAYYELDVALMIPECTSTDRFSLELLRNGNEVLAGVSHLSMMGSTPCLQSRHRFYSKQGDLLDIRCKGSPRRTSASESTIRIQQL